MPSVKVRVKSVYAFGLGRERREAFDSGKDLVLDLEAGTTVEGLLSVLPSLGPPESFDDMMMHVFVNGEARGFDYVLGRGDVVDIHLPASGG
jgi:molybdopterin converting factor small subunit